MGDLLLAAEDCCKSARAAEDDYHPQTLGTPGGPWGITWEVYRASPWGIPQGDIPGPVCLSVNTLRGLRNHVLSVICQSYAYFLVDIALPLFSNVDK